MTKLEFQARVDAAGPFRVELEQVTDTIDVTTAAGTKVPNLAWEFVDAAGHYHAWTKSEELPTLDRHVTHHPGDDDEDDGWDEIITVCKLCAEPVSPAYTVDQSTKVIPGRSWWTAEVYGVHLEMGSQVSISFSAAHTGRVLYFGIAQVVGNNLMTKGGAPSYVSALQGVGPLGRKRGQ